MLRLDKFKRYPLTFGPTPIEHLPRMTEALGGKVQIYAKRDDCNSGLAMGGNKLRKLEYIVPDAIASNADTLVSIGGIQSNHTRMVAATAAKIGMKCVVVQETWVPHEDAVYDRVGNILLTRLMGAESRIVAVGFEIGSVDLEFLGGGLHHHPASFTGGGHDSVADAMGAARGETAHAVRTGVGIGGVDIDILDRHAERLGADLPGHRLHALAEIDG